MNMRMHVMDFIQQHEGGPLDLSMEDVSNGFRRLKRKHKLDMDEVCVKSFELLFLAQPFQFTNWLGKFIGSTRRMQHLAIHARVFGKQHATSPADETRVIMPLSTMLAIYDSILPFLVEPHIEQLFPQPDSVFHAARKHTHTST